ncbi:hypothetical protein K469DRAFT_697056 [Zopfia rhizophila CBS 207.26]|uniref:Uncharacterized protein n=1 Tax=Zopfia rhizophila CBS 207.26 TaxID=1314779 RepID=A0A6A6EJ09_9PEZI|nr:hypothetical protein K469DRAFT_697056 [Zopfia rhizophila CBS 207.26]
MPATKLSPYFLLIALLRPPALNEIPSNALFSQHQSALAPSILEQTSLIYATFPLFSQLPVSAPANDAPSSRAESTNENKNEEPSSNTKTVPLPPDYICPNEIAIWEIFFCKDCGGAVNIGELQRNGWRRATCLGFENGMWKEKSVDCSLIGRTLIMSVLRRAYVNRRRLKGAESF